MDEPVSQDATRSDGSGAPAAASLSFDPRDLIPTPIFCANPEGRLVWINAAAERLVGRTAAELAGQPFSTLFPESIRRRTARQFIKNRRRDVKDFYVEAPLATGDKESHWVGMHVRLAVAGNGRTAYLCSAHDLQAIHAELEGLRRGAKEAEARLSEVTAGAELKSAFLASMSHELRAPMNGVIGMSRLLLDSGLDRDQHTFAEVIRTSGEQLLELVDDILDYSRIESGHLEIGHMDFDVRVTVDAVASLLAGEAHERGVAFSSWVHHRVPSRLNGDPGRVRQVLLDVARHAMRSAERGELALRVELVDETAHQAVLRFWVNRAHAGEDSDAAARVFSAFGEIEGATLPAPSDATPPPSGARSLGLSIGRRIVHLMGGDTGVVAVPGLGARLWFRTPFGKQVEAEAPAPEATPEVGMSGLRVLVADASKSAREALVARLSTWGCVCDEAEGGLDALERLKKNAASGRAYAIAIVDLELPELDARMLASSVREDLQLAKTGLVLLTTVGRPGDAVRAGEWGYDAYFVKPLDDAQLQGTVNEVVQRRRADARSGETALITRYTLAEQRRSRVRVLVAEDNPIDQLVLLSALKRVGYAPEAVTTAEDTLAAATRQAFDILFLDLSMSGVDGPEVATRIRAAETGGHRAPIVALTGRLREEERQRWLAAGVDDFLGKPIDLELMCATVEKWVHHPVEAPVAIEAEPAPAVETPAIEAAAPEPPVAEADVVEAPAPPTDTAAPAEVAPAMEAAVPWVDQDPAGWTEPAHEDGTQQEVVTATAPAAPEPAGVETAVAEAPAAEKPAEAWAPSDDWRLQPVLDHSRIETSSMGNPELRSMLVDAFLARTAQPLARLRLAFGAGDAAQVEIHAHALRKLCESIGATRAAALFQGIADNAKPERLPALEPWIAGSATEVRLAMEAAAPENGSAEARAEAA